MSYNLRHTIAIILVMTGAIGLVSLLASVALAPIYGKNGFTRKYSVVPLKVVNHVEKDESITDLCGWTPYNFYFKTKKPDILYKLDNKLGKEEYIQLNVPTNQKITTAFQVIVDSPKVDIAAFNLPGIIVSSTNEKILTLYKYPSSLYSRAAKISNSTYIFRGFDSTIKTADQILVKTNLYSGEIIRDSIAIDMTHDMGIKSDGFLNFDPVTNLLTYVYAYKNEFICIDTNLNLVNKYKTVDNIREYQTTVGNVSKSKVFTNVTARRVLNKKSIAVNGKLYNISNIKSDNEDKDDFIKSTVIDVYDIQKGNYLQSFYIPLYKRERVKNFKIANELLVAVYTNYIVTYELPMELKSK
jgi:hypothetical protein